MVAATQGQLDSSALAETPGRGTCSCVVDAAGTLQTESNITQYAEIWLLGLPPLSRLLEFVDDAVVEDVRVDRVELTDQWRAANDYYQELERREAGIANQGDHRELDSGLVSLAAQVKSHPSYRRTFDTLPTSFGMVELDRLIVDQRHVTLNFIEALRATIGPAPDPTALFRICMPLEPPEAPVQIRRVGSRRYVFRCDSTDLRFHEPALLRPEQANGYESFGAIAGIVGLVVGFGSNFLNAVRVGNRILLNNGYHRACALRALGITHAPCVIQTATRIDELQVSVKSRVADDAEFYFESARPPLLQDFFDPKIRKVLPIRKRVRLIEVNFEIRDFLVAE
jgi:hypothetical protein